MHPFKSLLPLLRRASESLLRDEVDTEKVAAMLAAPIQVAKTLSTFEMTKAENERELEHLRARRDKLEASLARATREFNEVRKAISARETAKRLMSM